MSVVREKLNESREDIFAMHQKANQLKNMVNDGILTAHEAADIYSLEVNPLRKKIGLPKNSINEIRKVFT